jgi:DNA repair exonuclease SbcCD ATPase subunit
MAKKPTTPQSQEIEDLRKQLDWLDQERRKNGRKLAELEQKLELQERDIVSRDRRIKLLEEQNAKLTSQISRIPQIDVQLTQFKDEIVQLIEQYDQRRIQAEADIEALSRVEHESNVREIADIRKELPAISRLQREMELRQAEETRLANLIGEQQNKLSKASNRLDSWENSFTFLEEKEKQNSRNLNELQAQMVEISKRWSPLEDRLDRLSSNLSKLDINVRTAVDAQQEIRESTKSWMEQIQIGEYERNQRLEKWQQNLDQHAKTIEQFSREWITFSDQYKEAKMAVQTLAPWQAQIEQQQRDTAELLRVETHRLQSQRDNFLLENDKKMRTFEVEMEQRWGAINRQLRQIGEQLLMLEESIKQVNQDKDTLWRVQTAQADALKQLPRTWLEEVEKAISQNPNRRRQPALVPIREE